VENIDGIDEERSYEGAAVCSGADCRSDGAGGQVTQLTRWTITASVPGNFASQIGNLDGLEHSI